MANFVQWYEDKTYLLKRIFDTLNTIHELQRDIVKLFHYPTDRNTSFNQKYVLNLYLTLYLRCFS